MSLSIKVDPIKCEAYGYCAELLPRLVRLDEWGYPIVGDERVPEELAQLARSAAKQCPRRALIVE